MSNATESFRLLAEAAKVLGVRFHDLPKSEQERMLRIASEKLRELEAEAQGHPLIAQPEPSNLEFANPSRESSGESSQEPNSESKSLQTSAKSSK